MNKKTRVITILISLITILYLDLSIRMKYDFFDVWSAVLFIAYPAAWFGALFLIEKDQRHKNKNYMGVLLLIASLGMVFFQRIAEWQTNWNKVRVEKVSSKTELNPGDKIIIMKGLLPFVAFVYEDESIRLAGEGGTIHIYYPKSGTWHYDS